MKPTGALASWVLVGLASALGALAFAQPLLGDGARYGGRGGPLLLGATVALGLAVAVPEAGGRLGARAVALLAAIVAAASALRFVEVLLPGPGGFTPIFAPLILVGWAWGPRLGFLAGTLTLAVSAVATGGVGPWLPYQAIVAGWIGLTAGLLPGARGGRRPPRGAVAGLAAFGALWGIGYGMLLSSWDWFALDAGRGALGAGAALQRYAAFYVATSLGWDVFGALGNAALIALAGAPTLVALARFRRWFAAPDVAAVTEAMRDSDGQAWRRAPDSDADRAPTASGTPWPDVPATSAGRDPTTDARPKRAARGSSMRAGTPPLAWLLWLVGALATLGGTRHPLPLALAILALVTVRAGSGRPGSGPRLPLAKLAPFMVASAAVYNMLAAHQGTTVLARLPAALPVIGGALTLESLAYGVGAGLMVVGLIAAFLAFQQAVSRPGLLALVPRAFGAPALAAAVALAWLPGTLASLATVREAQAVRGLKVTGPRGWSALVVPVAAGGMERAARLAESLALRGLIPVAGPTGAERLALVGALALAASGLLRALPAVPALGLAVAVAGVTFARIGARLPRRSARWAWRTADVGMVAAAWLPTLLALASPAARATLAWSPYPTLALTPLDPWVLGACAALAAPALLARAAGGVLPPAATRVIEADRSGTGHADRVPTTAHGAARDAALDGRAATGKAGEHGRDRRGVEGAANVGTTAVDVDGAGAGGKEAAAAGMAGLAVTLRDVGFAYDDAHPVLTGVSFAFAPGRLTLITGPSGSGKSTLLRIACGIVPSLTGGRLIGSVRVGNLDAPAAGPERLGHLVGLVPGDPDQSFVAEMVGDEVAAALEARGHDPDDVAERVGAALDRVGLAGFQARELSTLSGGERQRVAIAAALAAGPAVLLLDEPTSQLDDGTAADLVAVLGGLAAHGTTILVATHRPERFDGLAAARLALGAAPAEGDERVRADALPGAERPQSSSGSSPAPRDDPQDAPVDLRVATNDDAVEGRDDDSDVRVVANSADTDTADAVVRVAANDDPGDVRDDAASAAAAVLRVAPNVAATTAVPVVVRVAGLDYGWPGLPPVLRGVDLTVGRGEIVAILGASGAGKTTLLRLLIGRLDPTSGSIAVAGRSPAAAVSGGLVGYVPQDPEALLFAASVREEIEATLVARSAPRPLSLRRAVAAIASGEAAVRAAAAAERARHVDQMLVSLGLAALADRHPYDLSTGERQRAAIAAVLVAERAVLLLDEPTRGLDGGALARLAAVLRAVAASGTAVIVATHDRRLAAAADRAVVLDADTSRRPSHR